MCIKHYEEETTDPHPYTLCMLHSALGYRERAIADSYAQGTMHRAAHGLSGAFDSAVDINVKQMVLVAERVAYFDRAKEAIYDASPPQASPSPSYSVTYT